MKKFVALFLCLMLAVSMLSACGQSASAPAAEKPAEAPKTETAEASKTEAAAPAESNKKSDFPTHSVEIVVGRGAGKGIDLTYRTMAEPMGKALGQSVIISNVVGSGGAIAEQQVMSRPADGYTLFGDTNGAAFFPATNLGTVTYKDLYCVGITSRADFLMAVPADSPLADPENFKNAIIEGDLRCAHTGASGPANVGMRYLTSFWNGTYTDVPYDSGAEGALGVTRGEADFTFVPPGNILTLLEDGLLVPVFWTGEEATEFYGIRCPSVNELYPEFTDEQVSNMAAWRALFMRNDCPDDTKAIIADAIKQAIDTPEFDEHCETSYTIKMGLVGDEAQAFWENYQRTFLYIFLDAGLSDFDPATLGIERP